ncbi:MAG: hypothetical protein WKF58_17295 [Ilumatobacteraceae bacterium]
MRSPHQANGTWTVEHVAALAAGPAQFAAADDVSDAPAVVVRIALWRRTLGHVPWLRQRRAVRGRRRPPPGTARRRRAAHPLHVPQPQGAVQARPRPVVAMGSR